MKRLFSVLLFLVFLIASAAGVQADIYYVDGDVSSSGDGTSWATAKKTIIEAITASSTDDEIWVKQGTYALTATITVDKAVNIYGGFDGTESLLNERDWTNNTTTIDGGDLIYHCLLITDDAAIDGFTITGGNANGTYPDYSGGGIYNDNCSSTIVNCAISENSADYDGGGIGNNTADVMITNCTFSDNTVTGYGYGGAISNTYSAATISGCTFSGNESLGEGGAIYNYFSSSTAKNCTFIDNSAHDSGGAIYNSYHTDPNPEPVIINCIFLQNTATNEGGGAIYNYQSSPTITNCTFSGNSVGDDIGLNGHAIYNFYNNANPIITNCIFWGNKLDDEITDGSGASSTVTYSCVWTSTVYTGTGNINSDPLFVGGDDYHLQPRSPCIDVGLNTAPEIPDVDFEGDPRIRGGTVDMGADEFLPNVISRLLLLLLN